MLLRKPILKPIFVADQTCAVFLSVFVVYHFLATSRLLLDFVAQSNARQQEAAVHSLIKGEKTEIAREERLLSLLLYFHKTCHQNRSEGRKYIGGLH